MNNETEHKDIFSSSFLYIPTTLNVAKASVETAGFAQECALSKTQQQDSHVRQRTMQEKSEPPTPDASKVCISKQREEIVCMHDKKLGTVPAVAMICTHEKLNHELTALIRLQPPKDPDLNPQNPPDPLIQHSIPSHPTHPTHCIFNTTPPPYQTDAAASCS